MLTVEDLKRKLDLGDEETQKIIRVKITQEDAQNITEKLQQAHEDYIAPTEHAIMTKG